MKIIQIVTDNENNILGLGDDNKMYLWNEYSASWDIILVKND